MNSAQLVHFGLLTFALGTPGVALAQQDAAGSGDMAAPAPEPPPAETPTTAGPASAPAPAAAAPVAEPGAERQAKKDRGKHEGHGKHAGRGKHRGHEHPDRNRDDAPPAATLSEGSFDSDQDDKNLVFTSTGGSLQLKGRVFALSELAQRTETVVGPSGGLVTRDVTSLDLSLGSARFAVEYRSPLRWLSMDLELEIAGRPELKDAYILAGKRFFARAGQFKIPTAALELESPWTLPLARRGLIHDLLTEWLDVAGRRPGLALGYRGKGGLKPKLTLGAFQGATLSEVVPGDRDVALIDEASMDAQSLAARAELKLALVHVGAWYEHRVGSKVPREFSHFPTFGLDVTLDHTFGGGGVRVWLDAGGGKSLYVNDDKPDAGEDPLYVVGRALVGYRFGGVALGDPYLEPFGFFALLDPDTEVVADFATEAALGVNAGYWDRGRVTLQAEMTNGQRNFPTGFLDNQQPDRLSLLLQAGARF
ncbi:MAG TPA: hypothetical protein VJN18_27975 [Polyangiaceae bacterium]|nr:hypothetical protein [Polyangiaceae bacterium]